MSDPESDPTTLTEAEVAHLSRLFEDNHFTLLIGAVEGMVAARVPTASGDTEQRADHYQHLYEQASEGRCGYSGLTIGACKASICDCFEFPWVKAAPEEHPDPVPAAASGDDLRDRVTALLADVEHSRSVRDEDPTIMRRDGVPADVGALLRAVLAASPASGDDLRDRAAWERAVPVAATTTAANPTAGDDLRDRVTRAIVSCSGCFEPDHPCGDIRCDVLREVQDALAASPAPVVSRPETLREADERRADLLRMRSDALYERWEDGASLAVDPEAGEPTVADLDGTVDEADWLTVGHVLDEHEVGYLRSLRIPKTH